MSKKSIQAIVLAAGKSTRFNTGRSKLAEKICGREMIIHIIAPFEALNIPTTLVVGAYKEVVQSLVHAHNPHITFIEQKEPKGTGHALLCTQEIWKQDNILVINGDCPLVTQELLQQCIEHHEKTDAAMSLVTANNVDSSITSYGHVIQDGPIVKIIEEKDFTLDRREHMCINAGIYLFKREFLEKNVHAIPRNEKSGEFYLPELTQIAGRQGLLVTLFETSFDFIRGVNTLKELWVAEQLLRARLIDHWMKNGVRFSVAQNVHLDQAVTIGQGTYIGSGVQLFGNTHIGKNCIIDAGVTLDNATIGDSCRVYGSSIIKNSVIGSHWSIGPFAYIHHMHDNSDHKTVDFCTQRA